MFWRVNIKAVYALLVLALLVGLYGYAFTAITNATLRYIIIFGLALILILGAPTYAFLRYKKQLSWPTISTRLLLATIFVITGMPIITPAGLLYGTIFIAHGFSLIYEGEVLRGVLLVTVWSFAFYGLLTLWSLAIHFWNKPLENPTRAKLKRNVAGLVMGLLAVPALWTSSVVDDGLFRPYTMLASAFTVPSALFFILLLGRNSFRAHRESV